MTRTQSKTPTTRTLCPTCAVQLAMEPEGRATERSRCVCVYCHLFWFGFADTYRMGPDD